MIESPLILTQIIDDAAQKFFDRLRKEHFPPERNYLNAHLTLFHQLPSNNTVIINALIKLCENTEAFMMKIIDIASIGNGVAYKIESAELQTLHKYLQIEWQQWLIPQDKQKLWPHITVQNKVDGVTASTLLSKLKVDFRPFTVNAMGFNLWEYKGGPWEFIKEYRFKHQAFLPVM